MELDLLGRILPQMEQARTHLPPPPRLRLLDLLLQTLSPERHVLHLPAQRGGARVGHGDRDQEDPDVSVRDADRSDTAHRCRTAACDQEE